MITVVVIIIVTKLVLRPLPVHSARRSEKVHSIYPLAIAAAAISMCVCEGGVGLSEECGRTTAPCTCTPADVHGPTMTTPWTRELRAWHCLRMTIMMVMVVGGVPMTAIRGTYPMLHPLPRTRGPLKHRGGARAPRRLRGGIIFTPTGTPSP